MIPDGIGHNTKEKVRDSLGLRLPKKNFIVEDEADCPESVVAQRTLVIVSCLRIPLTRTVGTVSVKTPEVIVSLPLLTKV